MEQDRQRKDKENGPNSNQQEVLLFCPSERLAYATIQSSEVFQFPPITHAAYCSPSFGFFHPPRT